MKLDVKNLVVAPFGQNQSFNVELYKEKVDENVLAERTKGKLTLTRLEDEILAVFHGTVKLKLACDRCLSDFMFEKSIRFTEEYCIDRKQKDPEKLTVTNDFKVDIAEPLRQEIIAELPVKELCKEDCKGICASCGENLNSDTCKCRKAVGR